ncbi:hypothetical protein [Listeria goaensis]|uniref:hypothetical protein n=1 Tax=Listeria goaensis TaxID=1649188 RepID=UPI000B597E4C|nr:hypothetical protein [Listeria goaensis]
MKIGDRVRVINPDDGWFGRKGIITKLYDNFYFVKILNSSTIAYEAHELKILEGSELKSCLLLEKIINDHKEKEVTE